MSYKLYVLVIKTLLSVKNMKHQSPVIIMNLLHNFYASILIGNYILLYLSRWLRGKSSQPLPKWKSESGEQCFLNNMDFKNYGSKVVGSRQFFLSKSLWNERNTIFLTGVRMKPPKNINCVLVEYNYFLKPPRLIKVI